MRYQADHDLHIHSYISPCDGYDKRQTKEAILSYGLTNDFRLLCVTDHIWDRKMPEAHDMWWLNLGLDIERAKEILPLPQSTQCRFLFGMEVDMDAEGNVGISREEYDTFDFLILAPSHVHMVENYKSVNEGESVAESHKRWYKERLSRFLNMDLPYSKCGLAHFTTGLVCRTDRIKVFELFTDDEYREIFKLVAERGVGVELNFGDRLPEYAEDADVLVQMLRPYRIAREMGCKFYLGGDAHTPEAFSRRKEFFEQAIDLLELTEEDKFPFVRNYLKGVQGNL